VEVSQVDELRQHRLAADTEGAHRMSLVCDVLAFTAVCVLSPCCVGGCVQALVIDSDQSVSEMQRLSAEVHSLAVAMTELQQAVYSRTLQPVDSAGVLRR
jgi:hypothetical protein